MNISLNNSDALSGVLKIDVEKNDYEGNLEKSLREIRQKANIPGFRKGMVPMSMIKKMYGSYVLAEELNKIVTKSMTDYINENKINILGKPVQSKTDPKKLDLENDESFEFSFDLAYHPKLNFALSKKDKLTYYKIKIDDEMVNKQIDSYTNTYASFEEVERSEEEDLMEGLMVELVGGEPVSEGIVIKNAKVIPKYMKEETEQKKFIGIGVGEEIIFNPYEACKGLDTEVALLLKIDKEKAKEMKSDFSFEVQKITRNKKAELNVELYDKIFGEGVVKDETEFREKTKSVIAEQYTLESEYRFARDFHNLLLEKSKNITFADDILKRGLLATNENKTKEDIEIEYPLIAKNLRYQFAREKLVLDLGIEVRENDVKSVAERTVKVQYARYGMMSVPESLLNNHVEKMMEDPDNVMKFTERAIEEKLTEIAKEKISIEEKEITCAEFFNMDIDENEN
ncbi:MAG: trigger factor [Tannerella sp.]|jgi:trigger factor|nr:trigger factor [Tannerella sp.]